MKQKAFAYYLMREMMFQGAVTLMRESETVPLWPIEALVEVDGQTALKMRYCPSGDYEMGIFKNMSASDLEEMEAMIGCLAYWHSRGWAHLDVKPGNFLRTSQGPKLIDCGLSVHHLATKVSHYGTPIYFYKNTLVANRDPWRRDVHAMALSLCELIFKPGIISPTMDYAAYFKPLLTGLPQPLQRVLTRALSDTFEEKHPNAGDLLEDFRQARKEMLDLNKAQESLVGLP
ncbi:MAG: hypothetical protein IPJ69_02630 [Deltaproteobacteria bacterium]|nr:MAG: hypothetical protein IPJ69_02630 [Deltaproteobacteria bacterium]